MNATAGAPVELETISDFVRWAASEFGASDIFYGHGSDNAVDEALAIVLSALALEPRLPTELYAAKLTGAEKQRLAALIRRRTSDRIPAAYITNRAWFAQLEFYVDDRVLVPRSPIAELIEARFAPWVATENVAKVLELGTGSGCIAVATAFALPDADIDAVDISPDALEVARRNVEFHGVDDQVRLLLSDLYAEVTGPYDIIVTNPPYVDSETLDWLPNEYRVEPRLALDGGADGLQLVDRILREAPDYLTPGGILVLEVGDARAALLEAYPETPFSWCEFDNGGGNVLVISREELAAVT